MEHFQTQFNLKIFKIDKSYYEFRDKSNQGIIDVITDNHKNKLRHKYDDFTLIKPEISHSVEDSFEFWSYCYNQPKEKAYWKIFLPDELTESQNFDVVEFSFVLFIHHESEIYCIISGSGMSVIRKFIHPSFGIEIYRRLAKPTEDVVIELSTRGITGNISQNKRTFNLNQTIAETLEYSEIPTKIKVKLRSELKLKEFARYNLDDSFALLDVGSYFNLRKKVDFEELKGLITHIHNIYDEYTPKQLTLFSKINDNELIDELDETLKEIIVDDVLRHNDPYGLDTYQQDIIEVVHPSKLEQFYECNKFVIRFKHSRGKEDLTINERSKLYDECTLHIYNSLEDIENRYDIKGKLYTLNIVGQADDKPMTYGTFFSHITAEIEYLNSKYFRIDGHWYLLENDYLESMNNEAKEFYTKYCLEEPLLKQWPEGKDEDFYNNLYDGQSGYYVFDKILNDNIELCDLLVLKEDKAFFIHVKNGFNTKMRDLYVQVTLSAKRLHNDLKNNIGSSYLLNAIDRYNKKNPTHQIDKNVLIPKLRNGEISINFVMAFKNNHYKKHPVLERIEMCNSNIAKYCLTQVVKEFQKYSKFGIQLIDISTIES